MQGAYMFTSLVIPLGVSNIGFFKEYRTDVPSRKSDQKEDQQHVLMHPLVDLTLHISGTAMKIKLDMQ